MHVCLEGAHQECGYILGQGMCKRITNVDNGMHTVSLRKNCCTDL